QLTASDVSFSIVRPIVFKFARLKNLAIVYACLVVRSYFLGESESVCFGFIVLRGPLLTLSLALS
ncbi:hypothetical protein DFJ43DRAFT_991229, partial [Lentinula guzmanii]